MATNRKVRRAIRATRKNRQVQLIEERLQDKRKSYKEKQRSLRAKLHDELRAIGDPESTENSILLYRQKYKEELRRENSKKSKLCLKFIEDRAETPKYVCVCCNRLFFYYSVHKATPEEIDELFDTVSGIPSNFICSTAGTQT